MKALQKLGLVAVGEHYPCFRDPSFPDHSVYLNSFELAALLAQAIAEVMEPFKSIGESAIDMDLKEKT